MREEGREKESAVLWSAFIGFDLCMLFFFGGGLSPLFISVPSCAAVDEQPNERRLRQAAPVGGAVFLLFAEGPRVARVKE